jgi:hypothetical protein
LTSDNNKLDLINHFVQNGRGYRHSLILPTMKWQKLKELRHSHWVAGFGRSFQTFLPVVRRDKQFFYESEDAWLFKNGAN